MLSSGGKAGDLSSGSKKATTSAALSPLHSSHTSAGNPARKAYSRSSLPKKSGANGDEHRTPPTASSSSRTAVSADGAERRATAPKKPATTSPNAADRRDRTSTAGSSSARPAASAGGAKQHATAPKKSAIISPNAVDHRDRTPPAGSSSARPAASADGAKQHATAPKKLVIISPNAVDHRDRVSTASSSLPRSAVSVDGAERRATAPKKSAIISPNAADRRDRTPPAGSSSSRTAIVDPAEHRDDGRETNQPTSLSSSQRADRERTAGRRSAITARENRESLSQPGLSSSQRADRERTAGRRTAITERKNREFLNPPRPQPNPSRLTDNATSPSSVRNQNSSPSPADIYTGRAFEDDTILNYLGTVDSEADLNRTKANNFIETLEDLSPQQRNAQIEGARARAMVMGDTSYANALDARLPRDRQYATLLEEQNNREMELIAGNAVSLALDFTPYVGTGKGVQEVVTGDNLVTGQNLSVSDRVISGVGAAAALIPIPGAGPLVRWTTKGIRTGIRIVNRAIRGVDEIPRPIRTSVGNPHSSSELLPGNISPSGTPPVSTSRAAPIPQTSPPLNASSINPPASANNPTFRGGVWRDQNGQFAPNPNGVSSSGARGVAERGFMRHVQNEIKNATQNESNINLPMNGRHTLQFLLGEDGDWLSRTAFPTTEAEFNQAGVQAGHLTSRHSGDVERFALEDPLLNWMDSRQERLGVIIDKSAIDIDGIPVEIQTARMWEELGYIPRGTVASASPHEGWIFQ
jgi:Bacterial toxin 5/Pre-toxin TG